MKMKHPSRRNLLSLGLVGKPPLSIGANDEMNEKTVPKVKMPNREGFVPDARPDIKAKR